MSTGKEVPKKNHGPRINEQIRVPQVRMIGDDGTQYGVISMLDARRIAMDAALDLIEVSPNANPPVVKLMDYGKYKYQLQKKESEAKKKQAVIQVKEIKFRPNIEKHDLEVKLKKAKEFLDEGDKIKMLMQFRGREMAHSDLGMAKFKEIIKEVVALGGIIESNAKMMGNRVIAMIGSSKKK
ncbi:MAG: translation initiation factor IF-3 [Bacteriovoracaceae bacterium]|nr:translation initiation factor IF-3 [Bacteriovoracaceae bacterium]